MTRVRHFWSPFIALLAVLALVLAACGTEGGGTDETTTTAGPGTTQPTDDDGGDDEDPGETTTTESETNEEDAGLDAAKARSFRVGVSGEGAFDREGHITQFQLNKLPAMLAIEALNEEGWDIAPIFLNQSEAPVQALIQGSVDVANSSVTPVITAAAADAPIRSFAKTRNVEYVMLTTSEIETPEDLHGARVGLHANASTTTLLTKLLLADYPDVEPQYLIVPGSGNRIQAMLAGELDATAAQFGDDTTAMESAPGDFHVIFDFAAEMPSLVDSVYSYNPDNIDDETRLFMDHLLAKTVHFNRMVYEDPEWASETAEDHDVAEAPGLDRYIESLVFPENHGLDVEALDFTIQGLIESELIPAEGAPAGSDLYDGSIWDSAQSLLDD